MTRRHPTHWPDGTPRSQHNAFTQPERHRALGIDSIFAADHLHCTSLYNNWSADQRADDRLVCRARRGPARTVVAGGAL